MLKAQCLDELLIAPSNLAVAVPVQPLKVRSDGLILLLNRLPVLSVALDDERRHRLAQAADPASRTKLVYVLESQASHLCSVKILSSCQYFYGNNEMKMARHIFLLAAVMSRDALMIFSRLSWCSSSSVRKPSNMAMYGDDGWSTCASAIVSSRDRLSPIYVLCGSK